MKLHAMHSHAASMVRHYTRPSLTFSDLLPALPAEFTPGLSSIVGLEQWRHKLFRAYHGACINSVSPLLVALCNAERLSLDELAKRMQPHGCWREWLSGQRPRYPRTGLHSPMLPPGSAVSGDSWRFRRMMYAGLIIRTPTHPQGALGIVPGGRTLGVAFRVAPRQVGLIRTRGGRAYLLLDRPLPETIRIALPGRDLDTLIEHPFTSGKGWVIERVNSSGRIVAFKTGTVAWTCPWMR